MKDNGELTANNERQEAKDNLIATLNAIREKCESDIERLSVRIEKLDAEGTEYAKETEFDAEALHAEAKAINSYLELLNELTEIIADKLGDAIKGVMLATTAKLRRNADVYEFNACMMEDGLRNPDAEYIPVDNTWKISRTLMGRIDGLYEVSKMISEAVARIEDANAEEDKTGDSQKG